MPQAEPVMAPATNESEGSRYYRVLLIVMLVSPQLISGPPHLLIANSGSSSNFATLDLPVTNKRPTMHHITIQLPNGDLVTSTHEAELTLSMLLPIACHVHLVPGLKNCLLLSIGQLCDAGYSVTFDKDCMYILHHGLCILFGNPDAHNTGVAYSHLRSNVPGSPLKHPTTFSVSIQPCLQLSSLAYMVLTQRLVSWHCHFNFTHLFRLLFRPSGFQLWWWIPDPMKAIAVVKGILVIHWYSPVEGTG